MRKLIIAADRGNSRKCLCINPLNRSGNWRDQCTGVRPVTTFHSKTDRMYDSGPKDYNIIILFYYNIIL